MEECDKSLYIPKINVIDNNETHSAQKCDLIPLELKLDNKLKVKKSQLLSTDGWENYQKDLIRLCFGYWEENEAQLHVNSSLQSDYEINNSEIEIPSSLFAAEKKSHENFGFESKDNHSNNISMLDELQKKKYIEVNNDVLKSKQKDDPVIQRLSKSIIANINWKSNGNVPKMSNEEKKRDDQKKKSKKFSFYKNMSKQAKQKKKVQSSTIDRSTASSSSCTLDDLWKYKKWLDSVEIIKNQKHNTNITTTDNTENHTDKIIFDEKNNNDTFVSSIDTGPKQMELKVRKLIKSLKKKDRLFASIGINEKTIKCGSSNKFKYLIKNAFRGNQNELDLQLLDDYTKYINQKLKTWQTLLQYLEDIKQRECYKIKTNNPLQEDAIKYRFSERNEYVINHKNKITTDDNYNDKNSKYVDITENPNETLKRKKTKFFKLLHYKTKSTMDMRTTVKQITENRNNSVDDVRENVYNHRGWPSWTSNETTTMMVDNIANHNKNDNYFMNETVSGKYSSRRIRRSLSDTELLQTTRSSYNYLHRGRTAAATGNGITAKIRMSTAAGDKDCRYCDSSTRSSSSISSSRMSCKSSRSVSLSMGTCSRSSSSSSNSRDDVAVKAHGLCSEERHECFQKAVARLEYVGSTFKEQFRLAGLKTLCKVDVLAGYGHSAEAVDLFVTALPFSKNPELMIRKAEAAYDWKFFCHLSMWRHSYKD